MATPESILQSYLETFKDLKEKERFRHVIQTLTNPGALSPSPLSYYLNFLKKIDIALLKFNNENDQIAFKRNLYITYLLLLQSKSSTNPYDEEIKKCEQLLDVLQFKPQGKETIKSLEAAQSYPGMPASYCGIQAGLWLGERILDTVAGTANPIIQWMTAINEKRLYWVWGGGLLRTVLSLIPEDFYYRNNAMDVASAPSRFTGYMSWTLYFARFGLNAFLVIKETFDPSKEEDKALSTWERFKTQWDLRKFTLLNDSIWGIANMVCFFWFKGSDGDALTLALLAFDLFIAIWDFEEQKTLHFKKMNEYDEQIRQLKEDLSKPENKDNIAKMQLTITNLEKEKVKEQHDWDHKKLGLIGNISYALSLMIAFAVMTLPFMPIPASALVIAGVIGAVLCFALTVIYNGIKGGLEIRKEYLSAKEAKIDLEDKIKDFKALLAQSADLNDQQKMLLFLEIKQLKANSEYHHQMVTYQIMHLVRNMIIQSLVPVLIFVSTVFLPLGIGLGVLGAGFAVAVTSNELIEKLVKAKKGEFEEFDNAEYEAFCNNPDHWTSKSSAPRDAFFGGKKAEKDNDDQVPLLGKA